MGFERSLETLGLEDMRVFSAYGAVVCILLTVIISDPYPSLIFLWIYFIIKLLMIKENIYHVKHDENRWMV